MEENARDMLAVLDEVKGSVEHLRRMAWRGMTFGENREPWAGVKSKVDEVADAVDGAIEEVLGL